MSPHETYPAIARACLEIALDNGGINRSRPIKAQRRAYEKWLSSQPEEVLEPINEWLSSLSEDRLLLICSGGQDEPETAAAKEGAPPFFDDVLNAYFEEVC